MQVRHDAQIYVQLLSLVPDVNTKSITIVPVYLTSRIQYNPAGIDSVNNISNKYSAFEIRYVHSRFG